MLGDSVNFAIIDATAGHAGEPFGGPGVSRYEMPIANLPLIGHVVDELAASGIERARIIAGADVRRQLGRILGNGRSYGIDVSYAEAAESDGRQVVLAEIEKALSQEAVLLHPGDSLFRGQVSAMRDRFRAGDVDSVLPEQASVDPLRDRAERRASNTVVVLGPGTRPLLKDLLSPKSEGDDLVESLLSSGCRLAVCAQTEHWCYSGSTDALLAANRMMLDELGSSPLAEGLGKENQLHGRMAISPNAVVSNSIIHGPVSIDDRAVVEDSFIGPYTSIGTDVILSGAEIDNSIVLTGAEIRHPGFRIEGSIIAERARVVRSFELPRGVHLRLGPDSRVTFS
jgi:glucose-1-phosphate thymidylyltransferase